MSLRYSIYKVQTRSFRSFLSAANFYILAHLVELVKNFFQVFSNSFCARCAPGKPFITQLLYVIILASLCQEVFLDFRSFLISFCRPLGDSHILAHRFPIVKHFFTISAILLWCSCAENNYHPKIDIPLIYHCENRKHRIDEGLS